MTLVVDMENRPCQEPAVTIVVKQIASAARRPDIQRRTLIGLGLNKINDVRVLKDSPQVRGLINTVHYLVRVED